MKLKFLATSLLLAFSPVAAQNEDDEKECGCNPDPHFRTWQNDYYDYHGGCDLIFIQNNVIDLHIRTVETGSYSLIQQAAVRVGSDTLEIDMTMGSPPKFRLNGGSPTPSPPSNVGGAPFNTSPSSQAYELLLDNGAWIRFNTYSSSLSITAHGTAPGFSDSEGMGGKWNQAGLINRDGSTATTPLLLARDWRVTSSDVQLFTPSSSAMCDEPTGILNGCIRQEVGGCAPICVACVTQEQVAVACQNVPAGPARQNCAFDIRTTGDINTWKNAPFYSPDPIDPPDDDRCSDEGEKCKNERGTCVFECVETDNNRCLLGLCSQNADHKYGTCYCKISTSEDPSAFAVFLDWILNLFDAGK